MNKCFLIGKITAVNNVYQNNRANKSIMRMLLNSRDQNYKLTFFLICIFRRYDLIRRHFSSDNLTEI